MSIVSTIDSLSKMTNTALNLWLYKDKKRYIDEFIRIQKRLETEIRKEKADQDYNVIDHLNRDLILFTTKLSDAIATARNEDTKV